MGQWLEFPGYSLAKTVAGLGEDVSSSKLSYMRLTADIALFLTSGYVLIDCEHGNIDDSEMCLQVGAIASIGVSPIVRIPGSEPLDDQKGFRLWHPGYHDTHV